jgi:hypothetical protein
MKALFNRRDPIPDPLGAFFVIQRFSGSNGMSETKAR